MARFYPNDAPTPAVRPPYLVVTERGAWAYDNAQDALDMARQLRANGKTVRTVKAV